jgi:hypothetical protein
MPGKPSRVLSMKRQFFRGLIGAQRNQVEGNRGDAGPLANGLTLGANAWS